MPKQKYEYEYEELAQELGWTYLGPFPNNVTEQTNWICPRGHKVERSYKRVKERGCIFCKRHWRKVRRDYEILAAIHGIKPPREIPANAKLPARWKAGQDELVISFNDLLNRRLRVSDKEFVNETKIEQFRRGDLR